MLTKSKCNAATKEPVGEAEVSHLRVVAIRFVDLNASGAVDDICFGSVLRCDWYGVRFRSLWGVGCGVVGWLAADYAVVGGGCWCFGFGWYCG